MADWKSMAEALRLGIPPNELARAAAALDALEESLRPVLRDLPPDLEPCTAFRAEEDAG
jgi:hypothetical protein